MRKPGAAQLGDQSRRSPIDVLLLRGVSANLVGIAAPIVIGVFSVPVLLHGLGPEKFGLISLFWLALAFFSFLDLGLSRTLVTRLVELSRANGDAMLFPVILGAITTVGAVGTVAGTMVAALAVPISMFLEVSHGLLVECQSSIRVLGLTVPIIVVGNVLEAALITRDRFVSVNACRIVCQVGSYLAPVALMAVTLRVDAALLLLAVLRGGVMLTLLVLACREFGGGMVRPALGEIRDLLRSGRWVTLSSVIGSLMAYLDRFIIASKFPVATVAYYSTPFAVVSRVTGLAGSAVSPFYRRFSAAASKAEARSAIRQSVAVTVAIVMWPILIASVFSREVLALWLGEDFSSNSAEILSVLAVGIFFSAMAQPAFAYLQSVGRAHMSALLHIVQIPFYVFLLWALIEVFGVLGAAIAWTTKAAIEGTAMAWMVRSTLGLQFGQLARPMGPPVLLAIALPVSIHGSFELRLLTCAAFGALGLAMLVQDRPWVPQETCKEKSPEAGDLGKE